MDDRRIRRERHESLTDDLDRLEIGSALPRSMLVEVIDPGTIPTTSNKYFACKVIDPGGVETSGSPGTFADVSSPVFVLVVGHRIPAVGERMRARSIGGRWVSEGGGKSKDGHGGGGGTYCPCDTAPGILTWANVGLRSGIPGDGPLWDMACIDTPLPWTFTYQPTPAAISGTITAIDPLLSGAFLVDMPANAWFTPRFKLLGGGGCTYVGAGPDWDYYGYLYFRGCTAVVAAVIVAPAPFAVTPRIPGNITDPTPTAQVALVGYSYSGQLGAFGVPAAGASCSPFGIADHLTDPGWVFHDFATQVPVNGLSLTGAGGTDVGLDGGGSEGEPALHF